MEQRGEPRFTAGKVIQITLLGDGGTQVPARVTNFSANGVGVELPVATTTGTAVKIQLDDAILLGEVVYTRPQENGYFAGLHFDQTITSLAELARIVQAFEDDLEPQTANTIRERRQQHQ